MNEPALCRFEPQVADKGILEWLKEHQVDIVTEAVLNEGSAGVAE